MCILLLFLFVLPQTIHVTPTSEKNYFNFDNFECR